jgi:small ligand-binding sensory domain FIST
MFGLDTTPAIVTAYGLDRSEAATGFELGEKIAALASTDAPVFLFYDSVAAANPHRLHPAASLLSGLQTALRGHKVRLVGGGTLTDLNLNDGWVFDGESVRKHAAIALVFPPQASMATTVVHGCRPASAFMEVTKIEGAKVFELDGRPALTVIEEMLGLPIGGTTGQDLSLVATLGQKLGDPYAPYDENAYVNRLILNADRSDGSITLFEPDFSKGARVQIMSRDNEMMLQSAMAGAEQARRAVAMHNENAAFCLYIDCAGRASARSGARVEEADIVKRGLPPDLPFLGFYSGVEIAPIGGQVRALDWTGVIATVHHGHAG